MSSLIKLFKALLLICYLNIISTADIPSVNIYVNQNVEFAFTKKDLNNIINNMVLGQSFDGVSWSYLDVGTIYNGKLNITNFKVSVVLNEEKLSFSEVSDGLYISGNDSITITLVADFNAITGLTTSPSGKITINYTTLEWYFNKRVFKNDTNITVDCSVTTGFNLNWTIDYTKSDTYLTKYIINVIQNNATILQNKFLNDFNNYSYNYYNSNPNPTKIPIQTSNPNKTYNVDMSFWSNPFYDLQRDGIIYYFNGNIDKDSSNKSKGFLKNQVKNNENWDNFNPSDGNYQVFFSSNFFFNIINRIINDNSFNVTLSNNQISETSPYLLDINSLGQFYPAVYNYFPRDNNVYVCGSVIASNFTQSSLTPVGEVSFLFTIKLQSDDTVLLSWISILSVKAHYTYQNQVLNFELEHNISILSSSILQNPYGFVDIYILETWLEGTFKSVNDLKLLKEGLDFNKNYKVSEISIKSGNGILIYGNYILQSSYQEFKRLIEEKIKYLI